MSSKEQYDMPTPYHVFCEAHKPLPGEDWSLCPCCAAVEGATYLHQIATMQAIDTFSRWARKVALLGLEAMNDGIRREIPKRPKRKDRWPSGYLPPFPDEFHTTDMLWKALNRLLRECQWTQECNGYFVESRSGDDIGVAHMLREAEEAHRRYVHERGQ